MMNVVFCMKHINFYSENIIWAKNYKSKIKLRLKMEKYLHHQVNMVENKNSFLGLWGHSTTMWIKFYPILTPSPSSGQKKDILILSSLFQMTLVDFLLNTYLLFLSS